MTSRQRGFTRDIYDDTDEFDRDFGVSGIDYLVILYRQKWIVLGVLALCLALAFTLSRIMTPKYEAAIIMAPASDDTGATPPAAGTILLGLRAANNDRRDIALAALMSRSFIEGFIKEHDLLPVIFPERWDAGALAWQADAKPPTLEQGYNRLHSAIRIEKSTGENIVTFVVKWRDAKLAASWANGLVAMVNATLRAKAITEDDRMISYLETEYAKTTISDVRISIANLIEQQIKQRVIAQSRDQYALDVISPAEPTDDPAGPGLLLLLAGGGLAGLLLGIPLAFLRQSLAERRVSRVVQLPAAVTGE